MDIKKNQEYVVDIVDNGYEGEGIAKIDNITVFIPGAIKNEKVKILIVKVNKNYVYGKIIEIIKKSNVRVNDIECSTYKRCGGCNLRHIQYSESLKLKTNNVKNILRKTLNRESKVNDIIGMENTAYFRNKLIYPVGIENNEVKMGVYANRTHSIIQTEKCFIQDEISQKIAKEIFECVKKYKIKPYNEKIGKGSLRHIVIKIGKKTGEVMVILVVNEDMSMENQLVKKITDNYNITTIIKNVNKKNTNVILGNENRVLYGKGYIEDILGEYRFRISPLAFYQVNPSQAERLYNTAIKYADLKKSDVVYDLYCGIGTISLFLSKYVKKVYGIEIVEEAIKDAKENAKINNVHNVDFFSGNVENVLPMIMSKGIPNVIFVDPPRKGLDNNTVHNILKLLPEKVVYISCNPATMARDVKLLEANYEVEIVQPVDMFPYTSHVECIAVLKLTKTTEK